MAPGCIVTLVARLPLPFGAPQAVVTLPPLPALVTTHVQLPKAMRAGATSVTIAFVTSPGPLFVTMSVYERLPPGTTVSALALAATARSAFAGNATTGSL